MEPGLLRKGNWSPGQMWIWKTKQNETKRINQIRKPNRNETKRNNMETERYEIKQNENEKHKNDTKRNGTSLGLGFRV